MATMLLMIIYIAFIGLGLPDSLFGATWPAIYPEFGLPFSVGTVVTVLISVGTFISSFFSAKIINRFGTGIVTVISTAVTALAIIGFSCSGNILSMCLLSLPLGLGAGSIDAALNNYVAVHYKAMHMNFLHCFYGIGVSASPYLVSLALGNQNDWRGGYRIIFYIQLGITAVTIAALPLWKKMNEQQQMSGNDVNPKTLTFAQMFKMREVRVAWVVFLTACAIEFTCGNWGSTFLVNSHHMTAEIAARTITLFYIGITLGRFLSGVLAFKLSGWQLIHIGMGIILFALLILILPIPSDFAAIALFLIGLGIAPVFPNLLHLTPINFGKDVSQSIVSSQMSACYIGLMLMPLIFGFLAQAVTTDIFPYYLLILYVLMIYATARLVKLLIKKGKYRLKDSKTQTPDRKLNI